MEFKDKFIGFVDILGFKELVAHAEDGTGIPLTELLDILKTLGSSEDGQRFNQYGPTMCPESAYLQRDLDFQVTQISDCVIVSTEVSPAGAINLISYCWGAVINLLPKGIMCRGYITRGLVYHTDTQLVGSGYQEAYSKEGTVTAFKREADERGTPFVEVDPTVFPEVFPARTLEQHGGSRDSRSQTRVSAAVERTASNREPLAGS